MNSPQEILVNLFNMLIVVPLIGLLVIRMVVLVHKAVDELANQLGGTLDSSDEPVELK